MGGGGGRGKARRKHGKERLDRYYHLAKEQGYRARSAFKLIQLAQRFSLFQRPRLPGGLAASSDAAIVDLCAAPGGWLQVCAKHAPVATRILGIDLVPIKGIRGVETLTEDITRPSLPAKIKKLLKGADVWLVLHDGSPNMGTDWSVDAFNQNILVLSALRTAALLLCEGGTFVSKVFRSQDYAALLFVLQTLFTRVHATKPLASRNVSAEIFVVCQGYKKPAVLDHRLFDPKSVFLTDVADAGAAHPVPKEAGAAAATEQKRGQEQQQQTRLPEEEPGEYMGSEDDATEGASAAEKHGEGNYLSSLELDGGSIFGKGKKGLFAELVRQQARRPRHGDQLNELRRVTVQEFFDAEEPASLLVLQAREVIFQEPTTPLEEVVKTHALTTEEILRCLGDVQVLGKSELVAILKWRFRVKKALLLQRRAALLEQGNQMLQQGEQAKGQQQQGGKRGGPESAQRLEEDSAAAEASTEEGSRSEADSHEKDDAEGGRKKQKGEVSAWIECEDTSEGGEVGGSEEEANVSEGDAGEGSSDEVDPVDCMEAELALGYRLQKLQQAQAAAGTKEKKHTRRQKVRSEWAAELENFRDFMQAEAAAVLAQKARQGVESDESEEEELGRQWRRRRPGGDGQNDTVVETDGKFTAISDEAEVERNRVSVAAEDWRARHEGERVIAELEEDALPYIPVCEKKLKQQRRRERARREQEKAIKGRKVKDTDSIADDAPQELSTARPCRGSKGERLEEVPAFEVIGSGTLKAPADPEELARIQTVGPLLINRTSRMDLIDGAYNRYAFNDEELPEWFVEEEKKHNKPQLPLTKELMRQYRQKLLDISRRPIRKRLVGISSPSDVVCCCGLQVQEARARKQLRERRQLQKVKSQAVAIAESAEFTDAGKARAIEKIARKAGRDQTSGCGQGSLCTSQFVFESETSVLTTRWFRQPIFDGCEDEVLPAAPDGLQGAAAELDGDAGELLCGKSLTRSQGETNFVRPAKKRRRAEGVVDSDLSSEAETDGKFTAISDEAEVERNRVSVAAEDWRARHEGERVIAELEEDALPYIPVCEKKLKQQRRRERARREQEKAIKGRKVKDTDSIADDAPQELSTARPCRGSKGERLEEVPAFEVIGSGTLKAPADPEELARIQTVGPLLINRTSRMDLIDGAYNRYAFNDEELPEWFVEEEKKHNKPQLPLTKELMRQYRQKLLDISRRPIRKVQEARARKQLRERRQLQKVKSQAVAIAESAEFTDAGKARAIEKIARKAGRVKGKLEKNYYVVSRGVRGGGTLVSKKNTGSKCAKTKFVDRRMKKDKRARKNAANRKGRSIKKYGKRRQRKTREKAEARAGRAKN
eukprot:XP_028343744.1 putative rRNA methyltransferase [Physeter catodon]